MQYIPQIFSETPSDFYFTDIDMKKLLKKLSLLLIGNLNSRGYQTYLHKLGLSCSVSVYF